MSDEHGRVTSAVRSIRRIPPDIAVVVFGVILTNIAVLLPFVGDTPLRIVFGLVLVLFLPGYTFVAALFPERPTSSSADMTDTGETYEGHTRSNRGIGNAERGILSFSISIALSFFIGIVLDFTPWGLRLVPVLVSISATTVLLAAVATVRRRSVPSEQRFRVQYKRWFRNTRSALFHPSAHSDAVLNAVLIISVIAVTGIFVYAAMAPLNTGSFSELYLLDEDETGDPEMIDSPINATDGRESVIIGVENHEHRTLNYTVVAKLQRVDVRNNSTVVLEDRTLDTFQTRLSHDEKRMIRFPVRSMGTGDQYRLVFLLYTQPPPEELTTETAYRDVHLWLDGPDNETTTERNVA